MSMPDNSSRYKRTNLFLLRVWCDDAEETENEKAEEQEGPCRMWHGIVQRTVSGEAHGFDGKEELIAVLEAMLYKDRRERPQHRRPTPRAKPNAQTRQPARGNNQTEANQGSQLHEVREVTQATGRTRQVSNMEER